LNNQVLSIAAVAVRAAAMPAAPGFPELAMSQCRQAIDSIFGNDHDVPAVTAVAAIGAASGHVRFAAKAGAAIPAFAGMRLDGYAINKHSCERAQSMKKGTVPAGRPCVVRWRGNALNHLSIGGYNIDAPPVSVKADNSFNQRK
jgi:hypothetical protein